ncbi:MAG: oxygenase MpaB family protein [bacterium]
MTTHAPLPPSMRLGDTELDSLVAEMAEELGGVQAMAHLFKHVHESRRLPLERLRVLKEQNLITQPLIDFFAQRDATPTLSWLDMNEVRTAGEFFRDRGLLTFSGLAFASLPACYCWSIEADVLTTTGRLSNTANIPRRIPETAQLVLDVGTMDAFEKGGVGITATRKIRLMHALIRYLLIRSPGSVSVDKDKGDMPPWDVDQCGVPISQEFLLATLLTFHFVILKSLRSMSVLVSEPEQRAYIHRWNLAGYFLGVNEDMLSRVSDYPSCEAELEKMMVAHRRPTQGGELLSQTLIKYTQSNVIDAVTGGHLHPLTHIPCILTRYLCGPQTARCLGLHLDWKDRVLYLPFVGAVRMVGFLDNFTVFQWLTRRLVAYATKHIWAFAESQGDPSDLAHQRTVSVPDHLASNWKLR